MKHNQLRASSQPIEEEAHQMLTGGLEVVVAPDPKPERWRR